MSLLSAPTIDIRCSFWESFSFTPRGSIGQTIYITRMAKAIYILSYIKDHTLQNDYQVTNTSKGWIVEDIQCSPTSFIHHRLIDRVLKTRTILDPNHYLSLSPVGSGVKMTECMAICGLLFISLFTGHQLYHRKYSLRLVAMIVPAVLLVVTLILLRDSFRKNNAFWNAARLITVVNHARQNKSSIEDSRLLHNRSDYGPKSHDGIYEEL
jgi:hypothetical protein